MRIRPAIRGCRLSIRLCRRSNEELKARFPKGKRAFYLWHQVMSLDVRFLLTLTPMFLPLCSLYGAPAKVVVMRRNPLLAPRVDTFLPFGSRRDCQETFLVVVLYLGPLPSHAELAADFAEAVLHRVVQAACELSASMSPARRGLCSSNSFFV